MKYGILTIALFGAVTGFAEGGTAFLKQQAVAEMQRVSAQVDVLATNQEDLSDRLAKAESVKGEVASLRAEIDALKATVADLQRQLAAQRGEIVKDLSAKIATIQPPARTTSSRAAATEVTDENVYVYTVQSGDSLFLIAKAFGTSVAKIKSLNGLKNDRIGVGQKIKVPKE